MRKYLTQAIITESISLLEDAARTQEEFENVIEWWDKRETRIKDALDKKVRSVANSTFDIGLYRKGDYRKKNVFGGRNFYYEDYLNVIFCCICQMHNLTDNSDLSRLVNKATEKQKAVFFPRIIKGCSPQKISECHGMSDRNVRDIVDRTISKIRKGMYEALKKRQAEGVLMTIRQRAFMNTLDDEKLKAEKEEPNKTDGE
jgi:DNA-directed RNA polymerase specialized sigma24 family protein